MKLRKYDDGKTEWTEIEDLQKMVAPWLPIPHFLRRKRMFFSKEDFGKLISIYLAIFFQSFEVECCYWNLTPLPQVGRQVDTVKEKA